MASLRVGHLIRHYLRLTQTFIQSYFTHANMHYPQVLTDVIHPQAAGGTACVYLIDEQELSRMSPPDVRFFLSELDYPNCFENLIGEYNLQVLHAHFGAVGCCSLKLKKQTQLPLVSSFYGIDASQQLRSSSFQQPYLRLFDRVDAIVALGTNMADRLCAAGCSERKIHIVHLGVDLQNISFYKRKDPEGDAPTVLLYCGRLVEKKGIWDALNAFVRVADQWPNLIFRIAGEGPLGRQLAHTVQRMGLQQRVHILGAIPHSRVIAEMARAHIFILPSKVAKDGDMEGTPTVLLEAQASGLPVLSTHHADIPEVVLHGESGFLVPEGNREALAEKLELLLKHPDGWSGFGKAGRDHVETHYNIRTEIKKLELLYRNLI